MSKREKKSITDLMATSIPVGAIIEKATEQIHNLQKEKTIRATVDLPESFHKELRKFLIDEDQDLKTFCRDAIEEKYKQLSGNQQNSSD